MVDFWVYITGSDTGILHFGVAGTRRLLPHRGLQRLLYAEKATDVFAAIAREKQLRGWPRSRRIQLIAQNNPSWRDLAPSRRRLTARPPDRRPGRQA